MNGLGQRTSKDLITDARVITEGARPIACPDNAIDDPGGLFVEDNPRAEWINDENREIYGRNKGLVSADEKFMFDDERDLPGLDLIMDESRRSNSLEGLKPDDVSIKDVSRTSSGLEVVTESVWDVGWRWPARYFDHYSDLGELGEVVDEGEAGIAQVLGTKRGLDRFASFEDPWALCFINYGRRQRARWLMRFY